MKKCVLLLLVPVLFLLLHCGSDATNPIVQVTSDTFHAALDGAVDSIKQLSDGGLSGDKGSRSDSKRRNDSFLSDLRIGKDAHASSDGGLTDSSLPTCNCPPPPALPYILKKKVYKGTFLSGAPIRIENKEWNKDEPPMVRVYVRYGTSEWLNYRPAQIKAGDGYITVLYAQGVIDYRIVAIW